MPDRVVLCSECGTKNRVSDEKTGKPICSNCGKPLAVFGYSGARTNKLLTPVMWLTAGAMLAIGTISYFNPTLIGNFRVGNSPKSTSSGTQSEDWSDLGTIVDKSTRKRLNSLLPVPCSDARLPERAVQLEGPETCFYEIEIFRQLYPEYDEAADAILHELLYAAMRNGTPLPPPPTPIRTSTGLIHHSTKRTVAPLKIRTAPGFDYYVKVVAPPKREVMTLFIQGGETFTTRVPL
jgi:hypothetical protein